MKYLFTKHKKLRHTLSIPFIYGVFFAVVLLDIFLEIYHRCAFPLYGIPYVKRSAYIQIDRHRLPYLNIIQKLHCIYCGYVNGLFAYAVELGAQTEAYFCGIKHKNDPGRLFYPPEHQKDFLPYGDEAAYCKLANKKRRAK